MRKLAPLVVVVALALACVASANLLLNPGFEVGSAGGGTPNNWWKGNLCGQENWGQRSGTNSMVFWNWNNGAWGNFGQDVLTNSVVGAVITFSIYGQFEANYSSTVKETWMKIEYWTNGASAYTKQDTYNVYDILAANRGVYNQLTFITTNTLANVYMIKPMVGYGNGTNVGGAQAGIWDDADLTIAIPEPTMAALLGFAGLIFLAARRMVRK